MHLADSAVANQLTHSVIHINRPIFRGPLKDTIVTLHRLTENPAFFNGQSWFFALYIFSRLRRCYRDWNVPVVGCGNHHSIDIIPLDNFPEVIVTRTILIAIFLVHHLTGYVPVVGIDIANGYGLSIRIAQKVR